MFAHTNIVEYFYFQEYLFLSKIKSIKKINELLKYSKMILEKKGLPLNL